MDDRLIEAIGQAAQHAKRALVLSHIRPDGDAIGSLLGLGLALVDAGKEVQMVSPDGVPSSLRHLAGSELVTSKAAGDFDLVWVVDCSDLQRTGSALDGRSEPDINIDHHITNENFARWNLVETSAVATAEILANCLPAWGLPVGPRAASALLTGIITDTIGFRTANMSPAALRTAAWLMERGASLPDLYSRSLVERSFEAVRFWGEGLSTLERDGRLVWASLTREARRVAGYPGRDDADLINVLSAISGAEIAVVFVEQPNGKVKVSWRSVPGVDVSQVAQRFGGGGHTAASGAEIPGSLEEVRANVLQETRSLLPDTAVTLPTS